MDTKKILRKLETALIQLESIRRELASAAPKVPPSVAIEERDGICHFCKQSLGSEKPIRGVHAKCNQRMTRAKKDGEYTDAELVADGKIGPPKQSGRKKMRLEDYATTQQSVAAAIEADDATARKKRSKKGETK